MRHYLIMTVFVLSFLFSSGTISPASDKIRAAVFITDINERWTPSTQEEVYPWGISPVQKKADNSEPSPDIELVSPKEALNEKTFMFLPPEKRLGMLRYPGALLASTRAGSIFGVDYLFLVRLFKADEKWVAESTACHISDGEVEQMGLKSDRDRRKAVDTIIAQIPDTIALMRETLISPVIGSDVGKIYHRIGAGHITGKGTRQEFGNSRLAGKAGYRPCAICFPEKTSYFTNDPLETALGQELKAIVESCYVMSENPDYVDPVARMGQDIVKSCGLKNYTYRFRVLETDEVNAYSVPTGGVYVTEGLLELLESDDELGGIITHEIAHTECHHAVRMFRRARTNSYFGTILVIATGSPWADFLAGFVNNFFISGWSRGFEAEADRVGMIYMSAAGLDPAEYVVFMKKLSDRSKLNKAGLEWFRTHPTDEQRLKEAEKTNDNLKVVLDACGELGKIDGGTALYVRSHPLLYMDDPEYLKEFIRDLSALRFKEPSDDKAKENPVPGAPGDVEPHGDKQPPGDKQTLP